MYKFKTLHSLEQRRSESTKIREKYPDRYPVIIERAPKSNIQDIDKHKFLVTNDLTVGQLIHVIRKRIKLKPEQGIFLLINNTMAAASALVAHLYKEHKDEDGFLYGFYTAESVFGYNTDS